MTTAICTLFEGNYHIGAAALINSLHASGFRGRFLCGLRGPFPPWAEPSREGPDGIRICDFDGVETWLIPLATRIHFTNYKSTFLLETWATHAGDPDQFYYLDPDIVVKCPWEPMERWARGGLALCEDVNAYLPPRHPLRLGWMEWAEKQNLPIQAPQRDRYYSGGFIGVPKAQREFLTLWNDLIARIGAGSGQLSVLKQGGPTSLFHSTDQDALNLSLMLTDVPVNSTGPEGMDFAVGGHYLSHAIGTHKPWHGGFVKRALRGYPPSAAAKAFFSHGQTGPIRFFSPSSVRSQQRSLALAALIGRFYRRT
ncbi:MAG: hypothetical protein QM760_06235 [Nibricoccus sp.]